MIKRLSKKVLGFCYKYFLKAVILKNGVIFKEGNFKKYLWQRFLGFSM